MFNLLKRSSKAAAQHRTVVEIVEEIVASGINLFHGRFGSSLTGTENRSCSTSASVMMAGRGPFATALEQGQWVRLARTVGGRARLRLLCHKATEVRFVNGYGVASRQSVRQTKQEVTKNRVELDLLPGFRTPKFQVTNA